MDYEPYRKAIFERVCKHCIDLGSDGKCTLPKELQCGVERYLPQMISAVHSVHSNKLEDYVAVLREKICASCNNQDHEGICQLREKADCGLNRYFELIVEAIEEVDSKK